MVQQDNVVIGWSFVLVMCWSWQSWAWSRNKVIVGNTTGPTSVQRWFSFRNCWTKLGSYGWSPSHNCWVRTCWWWGSWRRLLSCQGMVSSRGIIQILNLNKNVLQCNKIPLVKDSLHSLVLTTPAAGEVREFPEMRSLNLDFLLILSNIFCCLNCFDVSSDKRKQSCFWIWGSCQHLLRWCYLKLLTRVLRMSSKIWLILFLIPLMILQVLKVASRSWTVPDETPAHARTPRHTSACRTAPCSSCPQSPPSAPLPWSATLPGEWLEICLMLAPSIFLAPAEQCPSQTSADAPGHFLLDSWDLTPGYSASQGAVVACHQNFYSCSVSSQLYLSNKTLETEAKIGQ